MDHIENNNKFKHLSVKKGISQPQNTDNNLTSFSKNKNLLLSPEEFADGILNGNRVILSRAITLVESSLPEHQVKARTIVEKCLPFSGKSIRVGITGVPGVGKSTFIEALGMHITKNGNKLAVLAIDPSSERSGGSILGDKTRMEELAVAENVFIRPSPSGGYVGGVAKKTKESLILCEAAGFDTIFIETVGVGQSETIVHSMCDFFLLLMLTGAGDELQGIKRGIMEMADAVIINKADGDNIIKAENAKNQYQNALHLFPANESGWIPKTQICSALTKSGIPEIWNIIQEYIRFTKSNAYFAKKRNEQSKFWMYETINQELKEKFYQDSEIQTRLKTLETELLSNNISSFHAAEKILEVYFKK